MNVRFSLGIDLGTSNSAIAVADLETDQTKIVEVTQILGPNQLGEMPMELSPNFGDPPEPQTPQKIRARPRTRRDEFCAINTGAQWLTVSRINATSSTDRAVVDPVSCRLGA